MTRRAAQPHVTHRLRRLGGAAVAVALVVGVLSVARPAAVWELMRSSSASGLVPAAAAAAGALVMRGLRLALLLPPRRIGLWTATVVASAAQAAAWFVPARFGELALPLLLRRTAGWGLSSGVGTLLVARTLDLAALGLWAGTAAVAVLGPGHPLAVAAAAALVVPPLLLPATLAVADRLAVRQLAPRGVAPRRWAHRVRRVRRAVDALRERPLRLVGAAAASIAMWALLWCLSWFLLQSMGHHWPPWQVVAGSAAASLANLLPFNLIGNFGTLEAGWTAAFVGLGVPASTAAATGFACHLWAAVFIAVYGALAWAILSLRTGSDR
jgi:uncharacterized membrane protein YbhN (UPF0104 family)